MVVPPMVMVPYGNIRSSVRGKLKWTTRNQKDQWGMKGPVPELRNPVLAELGHSPGENRPLTKRHSKNRKLPETGLFLREFLKKMKIVFCRWRQSGLFCNQIICRELRSSKRPARLSISCRPQRWVRDHGPHCVCRNPIQAYRMIESWLLAMIALIASFCRVTQTGKRR